MLGPAQRESSCGISAATFPGKRHGAGFPSGDVTVHGTCLPDVESASADRATAACSSASKSSTIFSVPFEKASAWAGATTLSLTGSKNGTAFSSAVGAAGVPGIHGHGQLAGRPAVIVKSAKYSGGMYPD